MTRRSPGFTGLHDATTATPVADVVAVVFHGEPRLALTAAELGQLVYGPPVDDADVRRKRGRIVDAWKRGEIQGRVTGAGLLIPGAAVVAYLRWLAGGDEQERETAA